MTAIILIDANIYLDLFRMVAGKKLLAFIEKQRSHIFISQQIIDEVTRNKLNVANDFFKQFAVPNIPDHLFGISEEETHKIRGTLTDAKQGIQKLVTQTLNGISQSEDDVSKRLSPLFKDAISPTGEEMRRARERKERGNPPGKSSDPLGDQITWEQFLNYCANKNARVWVVTNDGDFMDKGLLALNPMLYDELTKVGVSEIRCFGDLLNASEDFAKYAGVTMAAESLPTADEAKEIRKEIDALPPLSFIDDQWMAAVRNAQIRQAYIAATAGASAGPPEFK